jgi:dTMP kinase
MGLFITVEGGDFTGKTSLVVPALTKVLEKAGFQTLQSREPGGTPEGEQIREKIFQRVRQGAPAEELAEHFSEARRIHLDHVVRPFLGEDKEKKSIAILDRYIDSTIVYQGFEAGVSFDRLRDLEQQATRGFYPDVTLLLYFPEERFGDVFSARKRLTDSSDGRDQTAWDEGDYARHLERQRKYFAAPGIYREWGIERNYEFIDASQHPKEVVRDALLVVNPFLQRVEGNIRTEEQRERDLLGALSEYRSEGHLFAVENQWQRQQAFISKKGAGFRSKEK